MGSKFRRVKHDCPPARGDSHFELRFHGSVLVLDVDPTENREHLCLRHVAETRVSKQRAINVAPAPSG